MAAVDKLVIALYTGRTRDYGQNLLASLSRQTIIARVGKNQPAKMKTNQIFLRAFYFALLTTGCVSQRDYNHVYSQFSPIPGGEGRIVFYRGNELTGSGQRDTIWVNDDKVGSLSENSFFYLDRPAGDYAVSGKAAGFLQIELKGEPLTITLSVGETKYIRLRQKSGLAALGSTTIYTSLEGTDAAMQVLPKCLYSGEK